ncbi:hypothetical protein AB835_07970 [Candidatus Endobugula sertula]|uniref:Membrane fusion protein (MFP) family protein n=1 Tax=Candidatus Endobugula sertula TaxID=62101 RepID=A0A1D2QPZ0_9GAMM|nr:hypothetical protein AB835_07970 [Candidatus Endobugula sertula]
MKNQLYNFFDKKIIVQGEQEQLRYLPQSVKLEESANPHIIRLTMIAISVTVLIFVLWAAVTNINEVTNIKGDVVPRGLSQVVQHLDGGIVTDIMVGEGDNVVAGQILLKINDGGAAEDLAEIMASQKALVEKESRLKSFLYGTKVTFDNDKFKLLNSEEKENYIAFQKNILKSMNNKKNKEKKVVLNQYKQAVNEVEIFFAEREKISQSLKYTKEALVLHEQLEDKGYTSKISIIEYKQKVAEYTGEIREINRRIVKARSAIDEFKQRLESLDADYIERVYQDLEKTNIEILRNKEIILKLKRKVSRLEVKSPVDGVIKGLKVNTIGSVIKPGEKLMEILPSNTQLVVDGKLSPQDVGHVHIGQPVQIKLSSYDFSRYGTIEGVLDFISATTFIDDKNQAYYQVRIVLSKQYIGKSSNEYSILPGMTVEGDIITGKKTILSYLFKPIHLSLKTALTER